MFRVFSGLPENLLKFLIPFFQLLEPPEDFGLDLMSVCWADLVKQGSQRTILVIHKTLFNLV